MRARRFLRVPAASQIAAAIVVLGLPTAAAAAVVSHADSGGSPLTTTRASTATTAAVHPAAVRVVRSVITVRRHTAVVIAGESVSVNGRLLPASGGRIVHLLARYGRGWRQIAWARTGAHGGFRFRYRPGSGATVRLRVVFRGSRTSRASFASAGTLVGLRPSVASWYDDAGGTACGFHAYYGVANKTLPCGTHVLMSYGGRTVVATVDDRGPFVPGRDYDLNQNTRAALGMDGVQTVLTSI